MPKLKDFYSELQAQFHLGSVLSLLHWDQQVNLPLGAGVARASQIELIEQMLHERQTAPKFLELVDGLAEGINQLSDDDQVNVREVKRSVDRERKIPTTLVAEKSRICAESFSIWCKAKPENNWQAVLPHLTRIVELTREEAKCVGYSAHAYDALLDVYEPHGKVAWIKPLLSDLAAGILEILPSIIERQEKIKPRLPELSPADQLKLNQKVLEAIGYSFNTGRIDVSAHPFMCGIGVNDYRVTTRYDKSDFLGSLYGTLHEGGHALYEMGLPQSLKATPLGSALSMSVHESQSRLWENLVGRSASFAEFIADKLRSVCNIKVEAQEIWRAANFVTPSLIRVEADEVTYTQHILVRTLLEEQLLAGELAVADLPVAWNELYQRYLGVSAHELKDGVMQDVHWYQGSFGYFPSYALGNLYGACFYKVLETESGNLAASIAKGEFAGIYSWLKNNVHVHGKRYTGPELVRKISGKELSADQFIAYLRKKFLGS